MSKNKICIIASLLLFLTVLGMNLLMYMDSSLLISRAIPEPSSVLRGSLQKEKPVILNQTSVLRGSLQKEEQIILNQTSVLRGSLQKEKQIILNQTSVLRGSLQKEKQVILNQTSDLRGSLQKEKQVVLNSKKKVILVYTTLFGSREWDYLPEKDAANFIAKQGCKVSNCEITYDNNRLGDSDAVLFHARDMPSSETLRDLSRRSRPLHQRWAYFISENPVNTPNPASLNGLFNWTMTYKMESDIWLPYAKYIKIERAEAKKKFVDYATEKNKVHSRKLAIWVVSHCGRLRDQLVKKLQEFISVDVGGECGGNFKNNIGDCKSQNKEGCMEMIKNYKFYFSFENEFCEQYVSEKYWFNAVQHDAVPIVFGAGPYNHPKVAIPGSYIDVTDFANVKDLANHLIYLDKNDTAYNEYFAWKQKYKLALDPDWPWADIWGCEICDKLHNDHKTKIYDKLSEFWSVNNDCKDREKKAVDMINSS